MRRACVLGLGTLLLAMRLGPQAPVGAAGGDCTASITQQLDTDRIALGDPVGIAIDLDPGCGGELLARHFVLVLEPMPDAAGAGSLRRALEGFLGAPGFGDGRVGLVLGQADPLAPTPSPPPPPLPTAVPGAQPRVVPPTKDLAAVRAALAGFDAVRPGLPTHQLVRKARDLYVDLADASPREYGRRHLVVIGQAGADLGRESTLRFEAAAAAEDAIDLRWYCIGGGCKPIEGFAMIDLPNAEAVAADLAALRDRPAPLAIDHATLTSNFPASSDFVYGSAQPAADQMGRLDQNYIRWDIEQQADPIRLEYALRPIRVGDDQIVASWAELRGMSNAGQPVYQLLSATARLGVDPAPEQPSRCQLRAQSDAGPDPVALDATAWVTLTLVTDCPVERKPIDVVLAIDHSGSMRSANRMADAKAAARTFVNLVDLDLARVAVVGLGSEAELLVDLSQDRQTLLEGIERLHVEGENDFQVGIDRARLLLRQRRPDALPIVILISDGDTVFPKKLDDPDDPWLQAAYWAHLEGLRMVVVCITDTGRCYPKFAQLAEPASYYRALPGGAELEAFYAELALKLGLADFERLSVAAERQPAFEYDGVPTAHDRPSVEADGGLFWQQVDPLFGRTRIRYPLRARAVGRWPVAGAIEATWRDRDGVAGQTRLPLPELEVRAPADTGPCRLERAELRAEPDRLRVEESLVARSTIALACDAEPRPLEVMLVIDHSFSMRGERIETARQAVEALMATRDIPEARFGLVAFSDRILAELPLSDDRAGLATRLRQLTPDGDTNIGQALNRARVLLEDSRPNALRFVVLLTDGRNSVDPQTIIGAADALKDLAELMAICVGGSCDPSLQQAVSRQAYYFDMPDGPALVALFEQLGQAVVGVSPSELFLFDQPHDLLALVTGSEQPPPVFGPDPQFWRFGFPSAAGVTVSQELQALAIGRLPRTLWQRVEYRTMDGASGAIYLPPVSVEVTGERLNLPTAPPLPTASNTPTATPVRSPTPSPSPSPDRSRLWLPLLDRELEADARVTPRIGPTHTPVPSATRVPTASTTPTPSRTPRPSDTPSPSHTPTPSSTPTITPTPTPHLVISGLQCLGSDESVALRNAGQNAIALVGWRVRSRNGGETYRFANHSLERGARIRLLSGPQATPPDPPDLLWSNQEVWDDRNDAAELVNRAGETVDLRICGTGQQARRSRSDAARAR
ncbi:MAG: VWA domain-containing protein [Caldilineae bacterium]|nr:VWA domain-containing protein [Caldilineae bacterium]